MCVEAAYTHTQSQCVHAITPWTALCRFLSPTLGQLKEHLRQHDEQHSDLLLMCSECHYTSPHQGELEAHVRLHFEDDAAGALHTGLAPLVSSFEDLRDGEKEAALRLLERHARAADEEDGEGDGPSGRENQSDVRDENDHGLPGPRCKVCRKVFDTEGHLNSHMRTHGMAFIKAKRLSAAEK